MSHGLPSSETYDIYQDSLGFIWITTDRGLSRFDGNNFLTYDSQNSPLPNVVFDIHEISKTDVLISTQKNKVFRFNPCHTPIKFYEFEYNDLIQQQFNALKKTDFIKRITKINETFYFYFAYFPGYIKISDQQSSLHSTFKNDLTSNKFNKILTIAEGHIYTEIKHTDSEGYLITSNETNNRIDTFEQNNFESHIYQYNINDVLNLKDKTIVLACKDVVIFTPNRTISHRLKYRSYRIAFDEVKHQYFIASNQGLQIYDDQFKLIKNLLIGRAITDVFIDKNKSIWISTFDSGIFFIKNNNISTIPFDNFFVDQSVSINDKILFHDGKTKIKILSKDYQASKELDNIEIFRTKLTTTNLNIKNFLGPPQDITLNTNHQTVYWYIIKPETVYLSRYRNVLEKNFPKTTSIDYFQLNINAHQVLPINDSLFYLTSDQGLYQIHFPKTEVPYFHQYNSTFTQACQIIEKIGEGYVVSTKENGVYFFKDSTVTCTINQEDGLLDFYATDIEVENDSILWISSSNGLNKVTINQALDKVNIINITKGYQGLISNEITDLNIFKDTLWISTKSGICFFQTELFFEQNYGQVSIDSLVLNNDSTLYQPFSNISFDYHSNPFLFFTQISFGLNKPKKLEYCISETSTPETWKDLNTKNIPLNHLKPGSYNLKIRDSRKQVLLTSISIVVNKLYWQKWYFILLFSSFFILILLIIIKLSIKFNSKRKQRKLDKVKLEIKSLTAQMNPHFTFNTINSIQHYLIQNDKVGGIKYLSEYAKLMRLSLKHSRQELISIEDEIIFLKLYSELEKKRFDKNFEVLFDLQLESDPSEVQIPSLLLQPIIENAIIHGVNTTETEGIIKIIVVQNKKSLIFEVSDNGIGILNKKPKNDSGSFGLKILTDRLKIYNDRQLSSEITYSYSNESLKTGTIIRFRLSMENYPEL